MHESASCKNIRALAVFLTLFSQTFLYLAGSLSSTSFYIKALKERDTPGLLIGFFGMFLGIGYMLACPFDTTYYLRRKCGFDLKMISCLMMSISIVACSGIMNGGYYSGSAVSIVLASTIYDNLQNFTFPFLIISAICSALLILNLALLPNEEKSVISPGFPDHVPSDLEVEDGDTDLCKVESIEPNLTEQSCDLQTESCDLTPIIVFPAAVTFIVDVCGGYVMAIASPYLTEVSGTSVSEGGVYVMVLTLAMSVGSVLSGIFMQRQVFSSTQLITISALTTGVGLWLLFPGQTAVFIYDRVHHVAYGAFILIGCGGTLGEMASYKAMEDLQVTVFKRGMGVKNRSIASTLYHTMVTAGISAGSAFSVVVLDYLNYEQGALIMMSCMGVCLVIGVGLEIVVRKSTRKLLNKSKEVR